MTPRATVRVTVRTQRCFTMLEIMVVMGLLFVFMTFLTNILFNVTEVFSQSPKSQEIAQRLVAAWQPVEECLTDMAGPTQRGDRGSDARLLVQWGNVGFKAGANRIQVLRSTVRVDEQGETAMLRRQAEVGFAAEYGQVEDLDQDPRFQQALQQLQQQLGLKGRAEMLLLPWPQGDSEGAFMELRRGLFLPWELPGLMGESLACEGLAAYDPVADASKCLAGGEDTNGSLDPWEAVHRMESTQYMRNQLLRDSDWASMAHSLELRVPLVDAQLREVVAGAGFEPGRSGGKAALVRRAAPELPDALWSRPKSGFFVPVMQWLDEELNLKSGAGLASRRLALMVLAAFGVDLRDPGSGRDPIP